MAEGNHIHSASTVLECEDIAKSSDQRFNVSNISFTLQRQKSLFTIRKKVSTQISFNISYSQVLSAGTIRLVLKNIVSGSVALKYTYVQRLRSLGRLKVCVFFSL